MKTENSSFQEQIGIATLRILATFSVIMIHVSGPLVVNFGNISMIDWNIANFFDSISRYSVPVFFMISGALLLNKDYELVNFLKRRFGKILPPFLIWLLIYSFTNRYVFSEEVFDFMKIMKDVFFGSEDHLWFVYSLLGVYLAVPILRKWIKHANKKEILYVLIIWLITIVLTIPTLKNYFPKIDLTYFSGFIGYFILGYYLSLFQIKRIIPIMLIILGVIITIFGTYYFTVKNSEFYYYFYEYLCLNTLMVSSGMFMLCNKISSSDRKVVLVVEQVNQTCFGIYLMHPMVLKLFILIGFDVYIFTPIISILLITIVCFLTCFVIIFYLKKLKYGYLFA